MLLLFLFLVVLEDGFFGLIRWNLIDEIRVLVNDN